MIRLSITLAVFLLFVPESGRAENHICWLDSAMKQGDGIALHFKGNVYHIYVTRLSPYTHLRYNRILHLDGSNVDEQKYKVEDDTGASVSDPVETIPLFVGDEASVSNSPEDGCEIHAVSKNGKLGIQLSAYFNPPAGSHQTAEEFVPAQTQVTP